MGEIDTKSIESVQAALSLFGQKNDQRKHMSISTTEVQFTKFNEELCNAKAELSAAEESKVSAMKEVELMATTVDMEKEKTEELLRCVSEFNDVVLLSKVAAIEAENKYSIILSEKEKELRVAAVHAQE
ncbi:hypothetical protein IFM89_021308 [Coptis chinensis]|uniref:Uncharacterized protein n=1 Tax=Coptis chinensis TaxID=261450 RepID=A0A835HXH9_9MAGN|nr:hypothetical protein IFM89_021308 [Coptis chinensis]